jgi:tetratricopeptide (TPR) repeat protein
MVIFHPVALGAISREAIAQIARSVTVQIVGVGSGSGVIIKRQGNTYTVLSVKHAVETEENFKVITDDAQKHPVDNKTIKRFPKGVDLAILQFNSAQSYRVAELGNSAQVVSGSPCYVSGFPTVPGKPETHYQFSEGQVAAHASHALAGGYALAYFNETFTGMSGGPVLNGQGQLIGIHGQSFSPFTETKGVNPINGTKETLNLGIPLNKFLQLVFQVEPNLGLKAAKSEGVSGPITADDLLLQVVEKAIKDNVRGALDDVNHAIQLSPRNSFAYFSRGIIRYGLGNKQGAIVDFDRALRINPKDTFAYKSRGNARYELKDNQGAVSDFDQAIRLNPNLALAYVSRGTARHKLGNNQGAISDFDQAIRLNPNLAIAYSSRGAVRSALGDNKSAIVDHDQAMRLNPNLAFVYNNRGTARIELGDNKGAIVDFDQAIRIDPNYSTAYYNRGNARSALGDNKSAIVDFDQAIRIDPNFPLAYNNRGKARYTLGDKQGAILDFDQAIRIDPNLALAYSNRGTARYTLGDKQGAILDLERAATLAQQQNNKPLYIELQAGLRKIRP